MITPEFTPDEVTMLKARLNGGVIPRFRGQWYMQQLLNGQVYDFGGRRLENETLMETIFRGLEEESGIKIDDITSIHGVFCERSYGVILVEVDTEPVAMAPGAKIVRMANYKSKQSNGRLFITGLEYKMRDIEAAETLTTLASDIEAANTLTTMALQLPRL
jgi:hypothetical protein